MRSILLFCAALICCQTLFAQVDVLTQHNDAQRTGWNSQETHLNTSNVRPGLFGKLFTYPVDDQIFAQPLVVAGVNISGGTHNLALIATVNNTVYAFDADNAPSSGAYWQKSLTHSGTRPPANSDYTGAALCGGNYQDFSGKIGIIGTPVIDKAGGTIYIVSRDVTTSGGKTFRQWLHALDLATGNEKFGGPTEIRATVNGTGVGGDGVHVSFNPFSQNQRPGLLLLNGVVYIGWSSHCDMDPYHGWLMGYDANTLQQTSVYCTTSNGDGGGIWQSGNGVAADAAGNIYVATGNGDGTDIGPTPVNHASSLLKLATSGGSLTVTDYFTPWNYATLNTADLDFGSCETLLIPGMNRVFTGAKDGNVYLLNTTDLGKYSSTGNNFIDSFKLAKDAHNRTSWGYYKGTAKEYVYTWPENAALTAWPLDRAAGNFVLANKVQSGIQGPIGQSGASVSTSSNGNDDNSAVLWVTHAYNCDPNHQTCPGIVRAINAGDVTRELWNSTTVPTDGIGNYAKFNSPVVANGKVYIATFSNNVTVYGLENNGMDTCPSTNIALGKAATASSLENGGYPASNAFDGNLTVTRWSSQFSDAQWLYVDLGKRYDLCKVILFWEAAYGKDFDLQVSDDAQTWKTVYQARNNTSTLSIMPLQGSGRYVKMNGIHRSTSYGYSIFEMQVYGSVSITCQAPANLAASNIQQNSATISWDAVSGATGYSVQYKDAATSSWTTVSSPVTGTSWSLTSLSCGTDYLFQVAANCSNGQTSTYTARALSTSACAGGCGPLPTRWTGADIGNPLQPGQSCYDGATFSLQGSGADIGATTDQFQFAYITLTGDDQFTGHISSLTGGNPGDKAGVMIRQGLTPNAPNAFLGLSTGAGAVFQYRSAAGGNTTTITTAGIAPPYWVRLAKAGSVYSAYISADGLSWTLAGSPVNLGFGADASPTYAGLAITSHNNSALSTLTVDNYTQASPLPIGLSSFTGKRTGSSVVLQWTTQTEQNAANFVVERSVDGTHFASIATVRAEGNSNTPQDYTATDERPAKGINYYRLRMVDLDGRFSYSPVILVRSDD
ncbi:MAG TPA: discoidin domain-containing protein, partial [Puia sp.]